MKKNLPYLIGGVVLVVLVIALMASRGRPLRRMDDRVTLRQQDKIPYGTAAARHLLPSLFPNANVATDARYPGAWDEIETEEAKQAVFIMADHFNADEDEMERLGSFAQKGNTVFLSAKTFSDAAASYLGLAFSSHYNYFAASEDDTMYLKLQDPVFSAGPVFSYPGKKYESSIRQHDAARATVLGTNGFGSPNFVEMKKGRGQFFVHTSPLAFSNYFVLYKQNAKYFEQAVSVIPQDTRVVLWNEYFIEKEREASGQPNPNWLSSLMSVPAFRWGLLTALALLVLYGLMGMRRRQRVIPPYERPANDSLDFVKTLGRLYYDRGDHRNLAEKMSAYFLEHVRSSYKMPTHTLDTDFVKTLHIKSGYPEPGITTIVTEIEDLGQGHSITEERLAAFHRSLEHFYQNT